MKHINTGYRVIPVGDIYTVWKCMNPGSWGGFLRITTAHDAGDVRTTAFTSEAYALEACRLIHELEAFSTCGVKDPSEARFVELRFDNHVDESGTDPNMHTTWKIRSSSGVGLYTFYDTIDFGTDYDAARAEFDRLASQVDCVMLEGLRQ